MRRYLLPTKEVFPAKISLDKWTFLLKIDDINFRFLNANFLGCGSEDFIMWGYHSAYLCFSSSKEMFQFPCDKQSYLWQAVFLSFDKKNHIMPTREYIPFSFLIIHMLQNTPLRLCDSPGKIFANAEKIIDHKYDSENEIYIYTCIHFSVILYGTFSGHFTMSRNSLYYSTEILFNFWILTIN